MDPADRAGAQQVAGSSPRRRLALVTDVAAGKAVDVFANQDGSRVSHAYLSVGSLVEIRLLRDEIVASGSVLGRRFLIQYNGKNHTETIHAD